MKRIIKLCSIVLITIMLFGCGNNSKSDITYTKDGFITMNSVNIIISNDKYLIVDVRTPEEYNELHVDGSINIPYDTIDNTFNLDKDQTLLIYCLSGKRASIATSKLKSLGYTAYNMGGIDNVNLPKVS